MIIVTFYVPPKIQTEFLNEKIMELADRTEMLAAGIESNPEIPWYEHEANIVSAVEYIDRLYQVYAEAYKIVDGELVLISDRHYETSIFDP